MTPRLDRLRRDLGALIGPWLDRRSPPAAPRDGAAWPAPRPTRGLSARPLQVEAVDRLTPDAVAVTLTDPTGAPIPFRPGQFLSLSVTVGGQRLRRAYSLCSDPADPRRVQIAVKRVAGGRVSNHLNDRLRPGDTLEVFGPSGDYAARLAGARRLALISGGSGITPHLSILRAALADPLGPQVTLIYGNRDRGAVMFRDALDALVARSGGRLVVRHVLDDAEGPLTPETLAAVLDELDLTDDAGLRWLVCGPAPMMDGALGLLAARGVDPRRVDAERFTPAPTLDTLPDEPQPLQVRAGGSVWTARVTPGQTLLEAGVEAGAPMPFSCAVGGCGACKVRLRGGEVVLRTPNCLSAEERGEGWVLACVAHAASPVRLELDR
ncbi:MAG: ferredoxin--NADP reductase [Alphaproteobacteria bacterium]|nr:ferredoxin--NADP reductase [Alphaproteobacteria bacterium]